MFKGSGEVDWIRVLDANSTEVWREDFYNTQTSGYFTPFPDCTNAPLNPVIQLLPVQIMSYRYL
jgi:hypothetical protein